MYFKRKIDDFLQAWRKDEERLPLIVRGARQVGKTEAIRHFAASCYEHLVELNFVEEPYYRAILEDGYKPDNVIKLISRINPDFQFVPGKTLIFFDEIQAFPDIATTLKFFKQDGRFDVICSGSMLGIHYQKVESHSVGYKTDYDMRSFDFEEFLWTMGYQEDIAEDMLQHLRAIRPFSSAEMTKYSSLFMDYILLGGMPGVLAAFVKSKTFERTLTIQNNCFYTIVKTSVNMLLALNRHVLRLSLTTLRLNWQKKTRNFNFHT